jgi:dihydrofolate reductase
MAKLIYSGIMSLDGYTVDADGDFEWAAPDEEVFALVNELERDIGTYLYGRRLYEVMSVWQGIDTENLTAVERDFANIWRAASKIVYSTTLDVAPTPKTTLVDAFDASTVTALKSSETRDITVGGPTLAAAAIRAGLVDEFQLFRHPVVVGGGTPYFPAGSHVDVELLDERRFASGVTYAHYRRVAA